MWNALHDSVMLIAHLAVNHLNEPAGLHSSGIIAT